MYLARVQGRLIATQCSPGLEQVPFQLIQPLDETGSAMGDVLVATTAISSGPGDLVHYVDGREAALTCPETFVPVDAAIIGFVEQVGASTWNPGSKAGTQKGTAASTPEGN